MKQTLTHLRRLKQLVKHLRQPQGLLAHRVFNFCVYNRGFIDHNTGCGTHGCAMGECPAIWPERWKWEGSSVCYRRKPRGVGPKFRAWSPVESGMHFFGISEKLYNLLFVPKWNEQGVGQLPEVATKEEVADNIEKYVNRRWRALCKK